MQRLKRANKGVDKRIIVFALLASLLFIPLLTSGTASAAATSLNLSSYLYEDTLSDGNYYTDDYLINFNDNRGVPLEGFIKLFSYRNESIREYNNDITTIIEDYNRLTESQQISVISDINRIVRSLCRQDNNQKGLFYEIYKFILNATANHTDNKCEEYISKIQDRFEELADLKSKIHNMAVSVSNESTGFFYDPVFNILSGIWQFFGKTIRMGTGAEADTLFFSYAKILSFATQYKPIFLSLSYLVFIISFFSSMMNSVVRFDIADPKVMIKAFVQLIIGKVFLDTAFSVCLLIVSILNDLASKITETGYNLVLRANLTTVTSDIPVIAPLITFFRTLILALPLVIFCVAVIVSILKCIIKLMVRALELTCLITISPVFFAFLAGESTKKYFERFLMAFASVAVSIVFIAMLYAIGCQMIADAGSERTMLDISAWPTLGTLIGLWAICTFINKPPKIFSQILSG